MASFLYDPMVIVGLFIALGLSISFILQKYEIPHIVVYLLVGFILSNTVFISIDFFEEFEGLFTVVENVALGLIGFKIGTELKQKKIWKDRRVLSILLVAETGGAFILVFLLILAFTQNILLAILLAAISTATAPAATVAMLKKLRAKGSLTTRIKWILALDDVVAVVIIEMVIVFVALSFGGAFSVGIFFIGIFRELGIAIILGLVIGVILDLIVEKMQDDLEMMELTFGTLLFVIGVAHFLNTSVILTCIIIGIAATNLRGNNYARASDLLEVIMSPIITLFFVLVGARVRLDDFIPFPILAIVYLVARTLGKIGGSYYGGKAASLDPCVRNNIGLGLLAQGGVALGLVSIVNNLLVANGEEELGNLILTTVIISTIFSEILGSYTARFAITRAGEAHIAKKPIIGDEDKIRTIHTRE